MRGSIVIGLDVKRWDHEDIVTGWQPCSLYVKRLLSTGLL